MTRLIDADKLIPDRDLYEGQGYSAVSCEQIDNAPTVTPDMAQVLAYESGKASKRPLDDEWVPIVTRPPTEEEKEEYPDCDFMYDCILPDDGEEVLVTTICGDVVEDTFCRDGDYGCYFENYCDEGDVLAWQPKPKPYKGAENKNNIPLPPTTGSDAYK